MNFKHAYSDSFRGSDIDCSHEPSLAQQSFKNETDINFLLEQFKVTGQLPQGVRMPTYGDFTGITDFRSAMSAVLSAQDSFASLPAAVRSRFGNDPAAFVDFCSDSNNIEELRRMGLAPATVVDVANKPHVDADKAS